LRAVQSGTASLGFFKRAPTLASAAEDMTVCRILTRLRMGPL
jgi:hypothetical protein